MRFDSQKYLSEARAETTIPEWSQAGGIVVVAVLGAVLMWSFVTSLFDDGPQVAPAARSEAVVAGTVTDPTANPTASTNEPDGRKAGAGDVAWPAVETYVFGTVHQGLLLRDGNAVPVRAEGTFPDGSIVAWGESEDQLVWTAVVDVDGDGPGTETVSIRVELAADDSPTGFALVGVSG